jgi:thiamine-phosphate pyrophosphorylase
LRPLDVSLYVITDARVARGRDQVELIAGAIAGGATAVQLRDKEMPARDQLALGRRLRDLTRAKRCALIVNDRVDLALAIDADGVHLGQDDLPPSAVRALLGHNRLIGVSVGNPDEFELVRQEGADYIGTGPLAATGTKGDAGAAIGTAGVRAVREITNLPMVAIGGVNRENAAGALVAGANGIAVISAVLGADDPERAARELRLIVDASRRGR